MHIMLEFFLLWFSCLHTHLTMCIFRAAFLDYVMCQVNEWTFYTSEELVKLAKDNLCRVAGESEASRLISLMDHGECVYSPERAQVCPDFDFQPCANFLLNLIFTFSGR